MNVSRHDEGDNSVDTIIVPLPPELKSFVEHQVQTGGYASVGQWSAIESRYGGSNLVSGNECVGESSSATTARS
jgi:hypothetical protein